MRLSLRDILEMKQHNLKIPGVRVNILEELDPQNFIIQDNSRLAILKVPERYTEEVEVGKGLLVLPVRLNDYCIGQQKRTPPQKLRKMNVDEPEENILRDIRLQFKSGPSKKENKFSDKLGNTGDQESNDAEWENERRWAEIIIKHIKEIKKLLGM